MFYSFGKLQHKEKILKRLWVILIDRFGAYIFTYGPFQEEYGSSDGHFYPFPPPITTAGN